MRTTLAPGLIRSAKRNFNYGQRRVHLFEIGKTYFPDAEGRPTERNTLGIASTGAFAAQNWISPAAEFSFFNFKGVIDALFKGIRISSAAFEPTDAFPWLNPADAAIVNVEGEIVGVIGSLAKSLEEKYKLKQPVFLAELDFEKIAGYAFAPVRYQTLPRYPSVERDLSIVIDRDPAYKAIHDGIKKLEIAELTEIDLIDVYEGEKIPEGKVGLTLRFTFIDREKTLTVERVQSFIDAISKFLINNYGAGLRSI
jgi:phenylalanyl-tRNA synthetase beta chain